MSKRKELRAKRERQQKKNRLIIIGIISLVAILFAVALIYPSLQPIGEVTVPEVHPRPLAQRAEMGDPNAPVKIEEFADFQCPACKRFTENIEPNLVEKYVASGQVHIKFVPFSFLDDRGPGRESKNAAEAAYCAMDQGKFWEYHDILYANQIGENIGGFSDRRLNAFAGAIGLDLPQWRDCFNNGKYRQQVMDDYRYSQSKGVDSTPSFILNGQIVGQGDLTAAIDAALANQ